MRAILVVVALTSAARADTLALGAQAGECANCASGDHMGTLGAALDVEHAVAEHVVVHGELAHDWIRIGSDECEYQFDGTRTLAGAGLRWQQRRDAGVFPGLAIDGSYVGLRDHCAGSMTHTQLRPALVPALGYDAPIGARAAVRVEFEGVIQDLVTYGDFVHQNLEVLVGARYVVVL